MSSSPSVHATLESGHLDLPPQAKVALTVLAPILAQAALDHAAPVRDVELSSFVDPDDNSHEIVVTQWVELRLEAALDYWDKLEIAVEQWIATLPSNLAKEAGGIALEVRSAIDEPAL